LGVILGSRSRVKYSQELDVSNRFWLCFRSVIVNHFILFILKHCFHYRVRKCRGFSNNDARNKHCGKIFCGNCIIRVKRIADSEPRKLRFKNKCMKRKMKRLNKKVPITLPITMQFVWKKLSVLLGSHFVFSIHCFCFSFWEFFLLAVSLRTFVHVVSVYLPVSAINSFSSTFIVYRAVLSFGGECCVFNACLYNMPSSLQVHPFPAARLFSLYIILVMYFTANTAT